MSTAPFRETCNFCNNRQDKIDRLTTELEQARSRPTYTLKVGDGTELGFLMFATVWSFGLAVFWSVEGWKTGVGRGTVVAAVLWLLTGAALWSNKKPNN